MRKSFLSIWPKCIALIPLLLISRTRVITIPSNSTMVTEARSRCIGLFCKWSSLEIAKWGALTFVVRRETRRAAPKYDVVLKPRWLSFRFALYATGLIHGGIKVFHEQLGLGETREPKLLIEFVRI